MKRACMTAAAALLAAAGMASPVLAQSNVGKVIITEIFANPNDADGSGFGINATGDNLEFIEIYNTTTAAIDISGWYLDDEDPTASEPFPTGTILGPNQALVIIGARLGLRPDDPDNVGQYLPQTSRFTPALFQQAFPLANLANVLIIPGNITIANTASVSNEVPFLVSNTGEVVDVANYETGTNGWPNTAAGDSIVLRPGYFTEFDNNFGCAWRLASTDPTVQVSSESVFIFDPDGAGPLPIQTRDRLADAGNRATPGTVNTVLPAPTDCNANGIDDRFDTCGLGATSPDCNRNLIPDSCEPDLNGNGVPDACDVLDNREEQDRNLNNVLDFVDINNAGGVGGIGGTLDTNNNGIIDGGEGLGRVIITEIMIDPFAGISGGSLEWVEIQNVSTANVDISGYRLVDIENGGDSYTTAVPAGTILAPGELAVLCQFPRSASGPAVPPDPAPLYTEAEIKAIYEAKWGTTHPVSGAPIRFIPLARWGARATNGTPNAEVLTLVGGAVVNDANIDPAISSTSGPHPTRLSGAVLSGGTGTWVVDRGFIIDVANYSNLNSNSEPIAGWPGTDGHSSFILNGSLRDYVSNNTGPNWRIAIGGLDGAYQSNLLSPNPFNVNNTGEDFGSPGFAPTTSFQPATGEVVISEINYATNSVYPGSNPTPPAGQSFVGSRDEFVEIFNPGTAPVDVSGWYLQDEDGRTDPFPAGTVIQPSEAIVVIGNDTFAPSGQPNLFDLVGRNFTQEFFSAWGCGYRVIEVGNWYTGTGPLGLDRLADGPNLGNEILRLVKTDGVPADVVNYDDDGLPTGSPFPFGWPADASTGVITFWSVYPLPGSVTAAANDNGQNWAASLATFDDARTNTPALTVDGNGFSTGIFNRNQFGSPGVVSGQTLNSIITAEGIACRICPADFNGDGANNDDDLSEYITAFFENSAGPGFFARPCEGAEPPFDTLGYRADTNGDCSLNDDDLGLFITVFFQGCE